jgi:hypothetical protein
VAAVLGYEDQVDVQVEDTVSAVPDVALGCHRATVSCIRVRSEAVVDQRVQGRRETPLKSRRRKQGDRGSGFPLRPARTFAVPSLAPGIAR